MEINNNDVWFTSNGKEKIRIYFEANILSFRSKLDNTIYCDLLEIYDKHFGIETHRQGIITKEDLDGK